MTDQEKKNLEQIPDLMRRILSGKNLKAGQERKKKTILAYSSHVKLKAVVRWKERMARAGITTAALAKIMKVKTPRISEWLNFTWEPNEKVFNKIEGILYKLGA